MHKLWQNHVPHAGKQCTFLPGDNCTNKICRPQDLMRVMLGLRYATRALNFSFACCVLTSLFMHSKSGVYQANYISYVLLTRHIVRSRLFM